LRSSMQPVESEDDDGAKILDNLTNHHGIWGKLKTTRFSRRPITPTKGVTDVIPFSP
jgi:hypothetical protein